MFDLFLDTLPLFYICKIHSKLLKNYEREFPNWPNELVILFCKTLETLMTE